MPKYTIRCESAHVSTIEATYKEFDAVGGVFNCPASIGGCVGRHPINPEHQHTMSLCGLPAHVVMDGDGPPVAIFTGSGFTRRSTDSRANRNIDHSDWRSNESWPGNPDKKVKRPKVTNWTADDFRRGAI